MRKKYRISVTNGFKTLAFGLLLGLGIEASAQTVSTFESLSLPADSFWDGSDLKGSFVCGDAKFYNTYDTTYKYWIGDWAYTNMKNDSVGGYTNMYSAITASGVNSSNNYALGNNTASISLLNATKGSVLSGVYITNTTLVDSSLSHGDGIAKKFGGATGNDSDWFKVTIFGFLNNSKTDSLDFYLADYRFSDNSKDYIINKWKWVDLSPLKNVDSLVFQLSSTDNGDYGMNTPAFFAIDNFNSSAPVGIQKQYASNNEINLFPNPASNILYLTVQDVKVNELTITDFSGKIIRTYQYSNQALYDINVSDLEKGFYLVNVYTNEGIITKKFVKN